jgi:uncharacterized protein (TIGR02145 family)
LLLLLVLTNSFIILAQVPQAIHYQAVLRGNANWILVNQPVNLRISIISDSITGPVIYKETHISTTNLYGLVNISIGNGTVLTGDFCSIKWGSGAHFIKIEADTSNGSNYLDMGTSQILSVPYALYADKSGDSSLWSATQDGTVYYEEGSVGIGTSTVDTNAMLQVTGSIRSDQPFIHNGDLGISDTTNLVTDYDLVNDSLKYRTLIFSGGILVYMSEKSDWTDTIGEYLISFNCGELLNDIRDGQSYATVLIGTQCWMAENLNVGTRINSTAGLYNIFEQTDNGILEKYCYNNDPSQCDIYGGLYEWPESMQYSTVESAQGLCPDGWHLPTDGEWTELADQLGGWSIAGGKMKTTGTVQGGTGLWYEPNTAATNESGFSGLPGGHRYFGNAEFHNKGLITNFWSSTQDINSMRWRRSLTNNLASLYRSTMNYADAYSIRCLKND